MATQTLSKEKIEPIDPDSPDSYRDQDGSTSPISMPVTVDNFKRAESDMYFTTVAVKQNGLGKFYHYRELFSVDSQTVVRGNRDTVYSAAVFDLDAGPLMITMPNAGERFMSLMALNEDHYIVDVKYGAGNYNFTRDQVGTRYMLIGLRTLVNPSDPTDLKSVNALQDAVKVDQPGGPGKFEIPQWDTATQKKVRDALLILAETMPDFSGAFGKKGEVDPVRHLIGTAAGWGGNPEKDAKYLNVVPPKNDGKTIYELRVKDVPVDAFWSISVYNEKGYYEKNSQNAYTLNSLTAKKEADNSIIIHFGGDSKAKNYLPIVPGWNYTVRLYRPRPEILDRKWNFPDLEPKN